MKIPIKPQAQAGLKQALAISHDILEAMQQSDWEQVQSLYQQRQPFIDAYFRPGGSIDSAGTTELKDLNDQILSGLVEAREQTRALQMELQHGNRVAQAYLDIAGN